MASPNISFDSIPSSIRKPGKYIEFNTKLAVRTLPGNLQKLVLIGQRLATGSVLAGVPTDVFSDADAGAFFGRGSHLHSMAAAALAANPYLQLSCVALDDAVGTAASCTVTFTGTATAAGTITLWIADCRVDLPVSVGDTAATEATALKAALDALPDLPVSAIAAAGVVTLTAKNKGTLGNQIKVSASAWQATGLTVVATPMAAGATDPDLQTALSAIFSAGHHVIGTSLNDSANLTKLRTHLDNVSAALEQRGAVAAYGFTGTLAASTTLATTINSGRITCALLPGTISLPWEVAAAYAAVIAFEEDPARPLNTLALTGIVAPPLANRLGRTEQENALNNGVTPLEVGPGEKVHIVRAVTTYTKDPQGIIDISLFDLTTIRTLDYVRRACRDRISLRFPREKLSQRTAPRVWSELFDVLTKLEELEIVELVTENKGKLLVERDSQDPNRLNARIPCDVVNGLHVFAGRIDLYL